MDTNNNAAISSRKSSVGSIIATIIIIILIVIGALYFWGKRIETERANQAVLQGATTTQLGATVESSVEATATTN